MSGSGLRRRLPATLAAVTAASLVAVLPATASSAADHRTGTQASHHKHHKGHHKPAPRLAHVQLLTFNDFHGNLESGGTIPTSYKLNPDGSPQLDSRGRPIANSVEAGGVAYLAANLAKARKGHRYSITAAAGDLIGASPLISAAFHDEPTIDAMGKLHLEVSSVGNHEFDEGATELLRMQHGSCLPDGDGANNQNSCPAGHTFTGADFQYLAANVVKTSTGRTLFPSYWIKNFGHGIKIAFIGMTLKGTPDIVTKAGVAGLEFKDEVATANALVPQIKKKGVRSIVVLLHQGGVPAYKAGTTNPVSAAAPYDFRCNAAQGLTPDSAIIPIAQQLSPDIDLIVSGHTHNPYVCNIPDPKGHSRMVSSASSFGRLFTDINVTYNRRTRDIVRSSVTGTNKIVDRTVTPDAGLTKLVEDYRTLVAPIASRVIGKIAVALPNQATSSGENLLGDLIADAQVNDPTVAGPGTPDVAFMNPGGIRGAGLLNAGNVTFGDAFTVQPFNNFVVSMSMTGQQIIDLLNQQWSGGNAGTNRKILQVSDGLRYSYQNASTGPVLDESSITVKGAPLVKTQTYRVVANNFLSDGGDGFAAFTSATNKVVGGLDIDAFANYLEKYTADHGSWAPPTAARISTF
ncbi:MAG: bifunctional metallophosphatase/5'-nucleotidase [Actinomycetes bacterium]